MFKVIIYMVMVFACEHAGANTIGTLYEEMNRGSGGGYGSLWSLLSVMVIFPIALWLVCSNNSPMMDWAKRNEGLAYLFIFVAPAIVSVAPVIIGDNYYSKAPLITQASPLAQQVSQPSITYQHPPSANVTPATRPTQAQPSQPSKDELYAKAVKAVEDRYPVLNPNHQKYSQEAVNDTIKHMNILIYNGDSQVLALLKASDITGPFYMEQAYIKSYQVAKELTQNSQPSPKSGPKKATERFLPPVEDENACVYKAVMTDEEIARCRSNN